MILQSIGWSTKNKNKNKNEAVDWFTNMEQYGWLNFILYIFDEEAYSPFPKCCSLRRPHHLLGLGLETEAIVKLLRQAAVKEWTLAQDVCHGRGGHMGGGPPLPQLG